MAGPNNQELEQRITSDDIKLEWREGQKAPREMHRPNDAVVDGNMVYFRVAKTLRIYAYNTKDITWTELRECKSESEWCALAVINNLLTTVGGRKTNKLFSLTGEGQDREWIEVSQMPTLRSCSAVANTGKVLIVAGGKDGSNKRLTTVEIMDIETKIWSSASDIPKPLHEGSVTICNHQIYVAGGYDDDGTSKSVYTCTLTDLFLSCHSKSIGERLAQSLSLTQSERLAQALSRGLQDRLAQSLQHTSLPGPSIWTSVADLPVIRSASLALHGRLLAIGGCKSEDIPPTSDIHVYHPITNTWEVVSKMKMSRSSCFAVVLSTNEIMVVGGYITLSTESETNSVELATVQLAKCELCCLPLEKVQDWLKCEECGTKVHSYCAGVTKKHYEKVKKREIEFLCQYCTFHALTKQVQALKKEVERIKTTFATKAHSSAGFEAANKNTTIRGEKDSTPALSRSYSEPGRQSERPAIPKEKVVGFRKIWGTHITTSTTDVLSTISKLVPKTEITIKRKYKVNTKKQIVRWWFIVRGNEELLGKLDDEWEKDSEIPPKWQIMPLYKFSSTE